MAVLHVRAGHLLVVYPEALDDAVRDHVLLGRVLDDGPLYVDGGGGGGGDLRAEGGGQGVAGCHSDVLA